MDITFTQAQGSVPVTVIRLTGVLDSSSYEGFQSATLDAIEKGGHYILIDLTGVPYMSSAGVRALNEIFRRLDVTHGLDGKMEKGLLDGSYHSPHLKLLNPSVRVVEVLKMVGMDMYIEFLHDYNAAVASFK
ncbi:MAG TPA: STAS domain-containing protein [Anaerolineae bacterium]